MDGHKENLQIIDTLRRLNRIFVSYRDIKKLLSELCKTLVTFNQFYSVWIVSLRRNKEVEFFEHAGLGEYGSRLEEYFFRNGLNHCSSHSIENGSLSLVKKDINKCENCPLLPAVEYTGTITIPVYFKKELLGVIGIVPVPGNHLNKLEESLLLEFSEDLGDAINTIQMEEAKEILAETINRLTKSISGRSSGEVMNSFMENLLISLNADYAFIGKLIPGYRDRIRTISAASPHGIIDNFEYTLSGTPCEIVLSKDVCCFPEGVSKMFPKDKMLIEMGIEAYIGTPLFDSHDEASGIMVVLKKSPFRSETLARYIFQVFAARASSELMRFDTEQRILESENQYQELIERSKNPIYIIVGNHLALVNSAWLQMFEYTAEEVYSENFSIHQIVAPESLDLIQLRLDNFISGISQPFRYDLKAISKSGKKYDLDVSVTHLNWQGKRAVQGVYRNVTGAMRKERQLRKQLKESQENANMKTAFLSNISQEIQSRLTQINTEAEKIVGKIDGENQISDFASYVLKNNNEVLEHVNDIIDIAKIELGKMTLRSETFKLNHLIKDVIQYFEPIASKKGINLACCKKGKDSIEVKADPVRVRQILINLIGNALKYTDQGKVQIDYESRQEDVRISVADTGIGIPQDKQKLIYKSFMDPNGKLSGNYDGSGLGLSLTRSLVQLMSGKIWVESNSGSGSIFYFTIPLA